MAASKSHSPNKWRSVFPLGFPTSPNKGTVTARGAEEGVEGAELTEAEEPGDTGVTYQVLTRLPVAERNPNCSKSESLLHVCTCC